jgi:hypothetical protein
MPLLVLAFQPLLNFRKVEHAHRIFDWCERFKEHFCFSPKKPHSDDLRSKIEALLLDFCDGGLRRRLDRRLCNSPQFREMFSS